MTFADEILVMSAGRVVQRGAPRELFEEPRTLYVGSLIGSPGMNYVAAERGDRELRLGGVPLLTGERCTGIPSDTALLFGIRPEHLVFAAGTEPGVPASILSVQGQGSSRVVDVSVEQHRLRMMLPRDVLLPSGEVRIRAPSERIRLYAGQQMLS